MVMSVCGYHLQLKSTVDSYLCVYVMKELLEVLKETHPEM